MNLQVRELKSQFDAFKSSAEASDVQMRRACAQMQGELKIANERIQKDQVDMDNAQAII